MPSITFHPVVFSNHLKEDGTINVKIRVTFKRRDRKLPTTINVTKADLTRGGKIKSQSIIDKLDAECRRLRSLTEDLNAFALEEMDVDDIIAHIRRRSREQDFHLDFCKWWEQVAARKSVNSASVYLSALRSFKAFLGKDKCDISEVTSALLRSYESWLTDRHGKDARAVSHYLSCLAKAHKEARLKYNSEELEHLPIRNPFDYYKPPRQAPSKVGHRDTSLDVLRLMVEQVDSLKGRERVGVSLYLISFACMGCNVPDLYAMMPPVDGILSYNRQKTRTRRADNAPCKIRMEECVESLLSQWADPTGNRAFRWYLRYANYKCLAATANKGLARWCKGNSLPVLTMYSARHTWATMAYAMGIPAHIITDALVHSDASRAMDDIYTNKDWSLVWDANSRVISPVFSSAPPIPQA